MATPGYDCCVLTRDEYHAMRAGTAHTHLDGLPVYLVDTRPAMIAKVIALEDAGQRVAYVRWYAGAKT